MAHAWREYRYPVLIDNMLKKPRRKCDRCKAVQTRTTQTAWMRVTGYRWMPLVGRCPKDTK